MNNKDTYRQHGYTKHYYVEADRIASKIGGGMSHSGNDFGEHIYEFDISTQNDYGRKSEENAKTMYNHLDSAQSNVGSQFEVLVDVDYRIIRKFTETDEPETNIFFFHKDHLGSSTQISDMGQKIIHHIEYMPTGEQFLEQRDYWHTPFKFNGKELDEETGLYYYGARYYTPEVGVWLSVDPLSDKYPSMSAFMYCAGNPVVLVDPDGRELELADDWVRTERGTYLYDSRVKSQKDAVKRYGDKSQSIGTGYSFNSDYGKVILGDDGNFTVDGKSGKIGDQAKGFSKAWASVKGAVNKIDEGGSSHSSFDNKVREKAEPLAQGLALFNPILGVANDINILNKGEDIYGNKASDGDKALSAISIATCGVSRKVSAAVGVGQKAIKAMEKTNFGITIYNVIKTIGGSDEKSK